MRVNPDLSAFFAERRPGPKANPEEPLRLRRDRRILELRRTAALSVGEISRKLGEEGMPAGTTTVQRVLAGTVSASCRAGRPAKSALRPAAARVADVRELTCRRGACAPSSEGCSCSSPNLDRIVGDCGMPGSAMIPAGHFRALLALKLWGIGVMADILDPGIALFAGLNVMPKRSSLTEYSGRVEKLCAGLMDRWHRALNGLETDLDGDGSFDLDFHTIPWHGKDPEAPVERHCVSKRSRRQKGILAFLARDADARLLVYANARVRKGDQIRRGPPLHRVLGAAQRRPAQGAGVRFAADDPCQPRADRRDGNRLPDAAQALRIAA